MQSAGCWGICAAILKNPSCVLTELDFSVSLFVLLSARLSVCPCPCLSVCLSVCLSLFDCISVCMSVCFCLYMCLCPHFCSRVYLYGHKCFILAMVGCARVCVYARACLLMVACGNCVHLRIIFLFTCLLFFSACRCVLPV